MKDESLFVGVRRSPKKVLGPFFKVRKEDRADGF